MSGIDVRSSRSRSFLPETTSLQGNSFSSALSDLTRAQLSALERIYHLYDRIHKEPDSKAAEIWERERKFHLAFVNSAAGDIHLVGELIKTFPETPAAKSRRNFSESIEFLRQVALLGIREESAVKLKLQTWIKRSTDFQGEYSKLAMADTGVSQSAKHGFESLFKPMIFMASGTDIRTGVAAATGVAIGSSIRYLTAGSEQERQEALVDGLTNLIYIAVGKILPMPKVIAAAAEPAAAQFSFRHVFSTEWARSLAQGLLAPRSSLLGGNMLAAPLFRYLLAGNLFALSSGARRDKWSVENHLCTSILLAMGMVLGAKVFESLGPTLQRFAAQGLEANEFQQIFVTILKANAVALGGTTLLALLNQILVEEDVPLWRYSRG